MNPYSIADIQAFLSLIYAGRQLTVAPYGYNLTFSGLAQGASIPQTLSIQANADFVLLGISHRANIGAAQNVGNKTAPFVRALITDSGTGEQFTQAAVDLENISCNDGKPRPLPYPRLIQGKSALTVQLTNYAPTAETYTVDLFLAGVQVRIYN